MTDPIRATSPSPQPLTSFPDPSSPEARMSVDPTLASSSRACDDASCMPPADPEPNQCTAEAPPPKTDGANRIVKSVSPPSPAVAAARAHGENNAARVRETEPELFFADAGTTRDGNDFATVALIYGHDKKSGVTTEAASLSVQTGPTQTEIQAAVARVGIASDDGRSSLTMEALTFQANYGNQNKDGSLGVNAGFAAIWAGAEGTMDMNGSSVTLGAALGASAEASAGMRDSDGDGFDELCVRVGAGPLTVGVCVEDPDGWDK